MHEGRNHVVRRMLEVVGHPVTRLVRVAVGPIRLGDLKPGRGAGTCSRTKSNRSIVLSTYRSIDDAL